MSIFELPNELELSAVTPSQDRRGLDNSVLLNNAKWFARIRWFIILLFILTGFLGLLIPDTISRLGLTPPHTWPWILAGILITANVGFLLMSARLNSDSSRASIAFNIWLQIIIDLIVVTMLVHMIGSIQTFISFTYLFHIALACIFFPPKDSLIVTILASVMYLTCVTMELLKILPSACIFANPQFAFILSDALTVVTAGSAVVIWFVIWYLVSTLSEFVRERDVQLDILNKELVKADQEKNRLMLQTTHDLKAPFSGIESLIQILRLQHWNEMSEPIRNIMERIEIRSETLRNRIRDMLLLGGLRANTGGPASNDAVNLQQIFTFIVEELVEKAEEKRVSVNVSIPPITIVSNERQLRILFLNLISNAIVYSYDEGKVEISAKQEPDGICVSVSDHGIGIKAEALPHIFDEYFRTKEAAEFNKCSTGLGLAIVREIARGLNLRVKVISIEKQGTKFEVVIPARDIVKCLGG